MGIRRILSIRMPCNEIEQIVLPLQKNKAKPLYTHQEYQIGILKIMRLSLSIR